MASGGLRLTTTLSLRACIRRCDRSQRRRTCLDGFRSTIPPGCYSSISAVGSVGACGTRGRNSCRGSRPRETGAVQLRQSRIFRTGSGSASNKTGMFRNLLRIFPKFFRRITETLRKHFGVGVVLVLVLVLVLELEKAKTFVHRLRTMNP